MTPGARVAAQIDILEAILSGVPAEKAMTNWARGNRFAGSKDRAALRDLVFQALRCRRSAGALPVPQSARAWAIGALRANGADPNEFFTGIAHAPAALSADDVTPLPSDRDRLDLQGWVIDLLTQQYGSEQTAEIGAVLRHRAPITLRVNLQKTTRAQLKAELAKAEIETTLNPASDTALTVLSNPRRAVLQPCFEQGWFELQDAASQAVADAIAINGRVLDYCAGGGGKSLALAARSGSKIFAHDISAARMAEIGPRAARGGHDIEVISSQDLANLTKFDTVVCDLPCSGSGAWRRSPEGKWSLTSEDLQAFVLLQRDIIAKAITYLAPNACLALITCSIFEAENQGQRRFISDTFPELTFCSTEQYLPSATQDGLYLVIFKKGV
ncbi:RsmB/NOP family class I SAM-dependent RNA methyltransferase [uncultured Planktomarina sp.]|jgi:16S rRNA (cytosine967-C5)-methyltransferase|uniref:RsmB/NOP family class I SAM-dependent RNA methyltransferase n=1 Tax=uncultured Planktomarina sp. TaxID=1538529 RepID=UPI003260B248